MHILKILQLCCVDVNICIWMEYSSLTLRSLWQLSRVICDLHNINVATRSWIIALGIRYQPRPYRHSHGDANLFSRIHALVTQGYRQYHYIQMTYARRIDNLIKIARENVRASSLHLAHINARSIKNKIPQFQEYITYANIDLCALTETWLKPDDDDIAKVVPPQGYTFLSWPRQDGWRGGGIAIVSHILILRKTKTKLNTKPWSFYTIC